MVWCASRGVCKRTEGCLYLLKNFDPDRDL
jgi:hypothetical protein